MKKSLVALTFAMEMSVYPALMLVVIKELDSPNGMTMDGVNYGWVFYLLLILGFRSRWDLSVRSWLGSPLLKTKLITFFMN